MSSSSTYDPAQSRKWKALDDAKKAADRVLALGWLMTFGALLAHLIDAVVWKDFDIWLGSAWFAARVAILGVYTGGNVAAKYVLAKHGKGDGDGPSVEG